MNSCCLGCDRKKYHDRRDKLEDTHRERVSQLVEQWEEAEKRYKLLKLTDEEQASNSIAGKCLIGDIAES